MKKKDVKSFLKSISAHSAERRLFEMLENIGEVLDGDIHVIQTRPDDVCRDDEEAYRVYHKNGYCFDAHRVIDDYSEDDDNPVYDFHYYAEWEGFDGLRVNDACIIIEKFMLNR